MVASKSTMRELRDKYVEMRAMRVDAPTQGHERRGRMRALASRFPGALREIDELPIEVIEERIAELDGVVRGDREPPTWALRLAEYHAWMRAALAIRREAGVDRDRARALAWIEQAPRASSGPTKDELRAALDAVLRPPGGRLNRWLFERIAGREGCTAAQIEGQLFPPRDHRR